MTGEFRNGQIIFLVEYELCLRFSRILAMYKGLNLL